MVLKEVVKLLETNVLLSVGRVVFSVTAVENFVRAVKTFETNVRLFEIVAERSVFVAVDVKIAAAGSALTVFTKAIEVAGSAVLVS